MTHNLPAVAVVVASSCSGRQPDVTFETSFSFLSSGRF